MFKKYTVKELKQICREKGIKGYSKLRKAELMKHCLENIEKKKIPKKVKTQEKYLKFYSKSKKGKVLSNFAEINVKVNNKLYITGEHAFHGEKYISASKNTKTNERKKELVEYAKKFEGKDTIFKTPIEAKRAGGKSGMRLESDEIKEWNINTSDKIQYQISKYKFENSKEVRETLEHYSCYILLHQDNRARQNTPWGARIKDGKMIGKNKLGKIWMKLR